MTAQIEGVLSNTLPAVMFPAFTCTRTDPGKAHSGMKGTAMPVAWGVFPIMGLYEEVTPESCTFFRLRGL